MKKLLIILAVVFDFYYLLVVAVTIALYVWFTFAVTEWRVKQRKVMNDQDTDANQKAIDSLLNYETVKYFGAEARAVKNVVNGKRVQLARRNGEGAVQRPVFAVLHQSVDRLVHRFACLSGTLVAKGTKAKQLGSQEPIEVLYRGITEWLESRFGLIVVGTRSGTQGEAEGLVLRRGVSR